MSHLGYAVMRKHIKLTKGLQNARDEETCRHGTYRHNQKQPLPGMSSSDRPDGRSTKHRNEQHRPCHTPQAAAGASHSSCVGCFQESSCHQREIERAKTAIDGASHLNGEERLPSRTRSTFYQIGKQRRLQTTGNIRQMTICLTDGPTKGHAF